MKNLQLVSLENFSKPFRPVAMNTLDPFGIIFSASFKVGNVIQLSLDLGFQEGRVNFLNFIFSSLAVFTQIFVVSLSNGWLASTIASIRFFRKNLSKKSSFFKDDTSPAILKFVLSRDRLSRKIKT
jgi:hypothetical protein